MSTHGGVLPPVVAVIELETKAMRRFAKSSQAQAPSQKDVDSDLHKAQSSSSSSVTLNMLDQGILHFHALSNHPVCQYVTHPSSRQNTYCVEC